MIVTILVAVIVVCIIIYCFQRYLVWSDVYKLESEIDDKKKNSFLYKLIPASAVIDSYKYIYFWIKYYIAKGSL